MTRIESGVTIPKGLITYTLLECQESDGQNFLAAIVPICIVILLGLSNLLSPFSLPFFNFSYI
jgi:hypothetical protein